MRSLLRLAHDEGLGRGAVSLRAVADKYAVASMDGLLRAHDAAKAAPPPGPFTFGAPIITGGAAALGGSVNVTVQPDAKVRWQGHAHDSGADGYHFSIAATVTCSSGRVVALSHSGHVGGTFTSGDENHDWDEIRDAPAVVGHLAELTDARFDTHLEYTSDIGSTLEAAVSWLVKSTAGTLLGPVGVVVFVGIEIGSVIDTGSPVPGARIAEGILWMAGPANTLFAIAAEGIASLGSRVRGLSQDEYDWADREVFQGSLPPRDKLLLTDTLGGGDREFTFPRYDGMITLNMGPAAFDDPRKARGVFGQTYVHELLHACQVHHATNLSWLANAFSSKVCEVTTDPYAYGPAGADYGSFNIEQQAQIVSDWFGGTMPTGSNQTGKAKDLNSPYFRYIQDNLRVGKFD